MDVYISVNVYTCICVWAYMGGRGCAYECECVHVYV